MFIGLYLLRSGRGKDERSRWDSAIPPLLPNTPQRMPLSYDGRDRTVYSAADADRWRGER